MRFLAAALLLAVLVAPAAARTGRDLSARVGIDGFTSDWADDERVFTVSAGGQVEEAEDDSKWGVNNDLRQVRISWDAKHLYLAGEGNIWGNNMVILVDAIPGTGLSNMTALNSWRRNFYFARDDADPDRDFSPDLFAATWDGNASPRLLIVQGPSQVSDQTPGALFRAAATFSQDQPNRAMEVAIPWTTVFPAGTPGVRDTVLTVGGVRDTFHLIPPGTRLKIAGFITAGGDGTGGPDAAPDVTRCLTDDGQAAVFIDNFATVSLDERDDTGLGSGGPDGEPDWGVDIKTGGRVGYKYAPPIPCVRFAIEDLDFTRPAFAPSQGDLLGFRFRITPPLDPDNALDRLRTVVLAANVFDMRGRFVRNLYLGRVRRALLLSQAERYNEARWNVWDGRAEDGRPVAAGIYVMRVVIEPNLSRATRALVVVR